MYRIVKLSDIKKECKIGYPISDQIFGKAMFRIGYPISDRIFGKAMFRIGYPIFFEYLTGFRDNV